MHVIDIYKAILLYEGLHARKGNDLRGVPRCLLTRLILGTWKSLARTHANRREEEHTHSCTYYINIHINTP
jgi:hypothetical protein